ncbi:MAG: hypothetical protein IPN76_33775 [Saprospiraceae bacterium]|nr:hypothetical protein [Saprospiraceae bacterium]
MSFSKKIAKQNLLKPAAVLALALLFIWENQCPSAHPTPGYCRWTATMFLSKNIKHGTVFAYSMR